MSEEHKPKKAEKIENLELNKETIEDLTEGEAENVAGGLVRGRSIAPVGFRIRLGQLDYRGGCAH